MARDFPSDSLAINVPLGTTWEETWQLFDDDGPVDLTGYEFRMFVRDRVSGAVLLEIDSIDAEPRAIITPEEGLIAIRVEATDIWDVSPSNEKVRARFDAELYTPEGADPLYVIPVVKGSVSFQPRITYPPVGP